MARATTRARTTARAAVREAANARATAQSTCASGGKGTGKGAGDGSNNGGNNNDNGCHDEAANKHGGSGGTKCAGRQRGGRRIPWTLLIALQLVTRSGTNLTSTTYCPRDAPLEATQARAFLLDAALESTAVRDARTHTGDDQGRGDGDHGGQGNDDSDHSDPPFTALRHLQHCLSPHATGSSPRASQRGYRRFPEAAMAYDM